VSSSFVAVVTAAAVLPLLKRSDELDLDEADVREEVVGVVAASGAARMPGNHREPLR
jgi:hypothetical protein